MPFGPQGRSRPHIGQSITVISMLTHEAWLHSDMKVVANGWNPSPIPIPREKTTRNQGIRGIALP